MIAIRRNALPRRVAVLAVRRGPFSPICRQSRVAPPVLLVHRQDFKEEGYAIGHDVIAIRRNALPRRVAVLAVRRALFSPICRQSRVAVLIYLLNSPPFQNIVKSIDYI